jgi:hypothetical protein
MPSDLGQNPDIGLFCAVKMPINQKILVSNQ